MRGKPKPAPCQRTPRGITPAGAGKTTPRVAHTRRRKDHPRRCGENTITFTRHFIFRGSPPQVRGKLQLATGLGKTVRITPAGAGKTIHTGVRICTAEDHPRRCGENDFKLKSNRKEVGSPPQVRGKLANAELVKPAVRITPAGAGKTSQPWQISAAYPDHPRRCGENYSPLYIRARCRGSPPQVRGKPSTYSRLPLWSRITPAGAGKTLLNAIQYALGEDHPRRCGENTKKIL